MARPAESSRATRETPRLLVIAAAVLLAARIGFGIFEKPVPRENEDADSLGTRHADLVAWVSPDSADSVAAVRGKPILYEFTAGWCPPCKVMREEVFLDSASAAFINASFVPSRVVDRSVEDGENSPYVTTLQARHRIVSFPTLVVVRPDTTPVKVAGYPGKDETMRWLRDAID